MTESPMASIWSPPGTAAEPGTVAGPGDGVPVAAVVDGFGPDGSTDSRPCVIAACASVIPGSTTIARPVAPESVTISAIAEPIAPMRCRERGRLPIHRLTVARNPSR